MARQTLHRAGGQRTGTFYRTEPHRQDCPYWSNVNARGQFSNTPGLPPSSHHVRSPISSDPNASSAGGNPLDLTRRPPRRTALHRLTISVPGLRGQQIAPCVGALHRRDATECGFDTSRRSAALPASGTCSCPPRSQSPQPRDGTLTALRSAFSKPISLPDETAGRAEGLTVPAEAGVHRPPARIRHPAAWLRRSLGRGKTA